MTTKRNILLLFLAVNMIVGLKAQIPVIENQKHFTFRLSEYLDSIGFVRKDSKLIDCDFRIWHDNYATGQTKMIRIVKFKNEDWFACSLDYYCYNNNSCELFKFVIDTLRISDTWNSTWKSIIDENLLNIKNQKDLNKELVTANGDVLVIVDGDGYCFEIATKKTNKSFTYSNVKSYSEFYEKNNIVSEDYRKLIHLIDLIDKEFDWSFSVKGATER